MDPLAVAVLVAAHLDRLGIPNTVGGSIASSSDRQWRDVRAIVQVQGTALDR